MSTQRPLACTVHALAMGRGLAGGHGASLDTRQGPGGCRGRQQWHAKDSPMETGPSKLFVGARQRSARERRGE